MEWIADHLQYFIDHPEVTWSGAGLTGLGVLYFLIIKLFSPRLRRKSTPPDSNTFTNSGKGGQNIAQGDNAIGQQNNYNGDYATNSGSGGVAQNGGTVAGEGGVAVGRDVGGDVIINNYPRTPQGIPLQRPKQAEHLVGRQELLKDVLATLQPGKVVTLCGPGGIGKTALASRVAWELSPDAQPPACFPDGLIFYSFYGRKDVSLAFDHLVRSFTDDPQDNNPEAICHLLANKQALIILDGAEEADDLSAVLRCCGGCGVLITSRKRSDAPGSLFEVKPLDELPAAEAFRLYSNTDADEDTVQAICQQLGGWPLALRLAGHYLRNTGESATDYLRWLEKRPFRKLRTGGEHQKDNAALLLERSVEQVSPDAVQVLRLAGVLAFAPISLIPVREVLSKEEYDSDSLELRCTDALGELVRYGLLDRHGERWQISHSLIHTFARTDLTLSREALKRLAKDYINFCWSATTVVGMLGVFLDGERVHCLRLIENCLNRELWEEVSHLVDVIYLSPGQQNRLTLLEMKLTAARKAGDRRDEAWCLNNLGYTCDRRGDRDKALVWYEQSLTIARELGDRQGEGETLNNIGVIYRIKGQYSKAIDYFKQDLAIYRELGDRPGEVLSCYNNITATYYAIGDFAQAEEHISLAVEFAEAMGHPSLEKWRGGLERLRATRRRMYGATTPTQEAQG